MVGYLYITSHLQEGLPYKCGSHLQVRNVTHNVPVCLYLRWQKILFTSKFKMLGIWCVLKSCFSKKVVFSKSAEPPKSQKTFSQLLQKKPLQLSGIVGSITKLPTYFIKNSTLPFETPSDYLARTDNTIFNKTKTLLKQ